MDGLCFGGGKQLNGSTQKDKYTTFAIPQSKWMNKTKSICTYHVPNISASSTFSFLFFLFLAFITHHMYENATNVVDYYYCIFLSNLTRLLVFFFVSTINRNVREISKFTETYENTHNVSMSINKIWSDWLMNQTKKKKQKWNFLGVGCSRRKMQQILNSS